MIRYVVIKFAYIFEDSGEVKEVLPKLKLSKDSYGYIRSALVDSHDNHVCAVFNCKKWVACFVPLDMPGNLFREHGN